MAKKYLFYLNIFIYLLITNNIIATPCIPTSIGFNTQAQIDSFAINYPDCTEIIGTVYISGGDGITNLNGLSRITSIGGNLEISASLYSGFSTLSDLTGLDNLVSIGGTLQIGDYYYDYGPDDESIIVFIPSNLTSLNGLNSLTSIGVSFNLVAAQYLTDISALSNLTSIGGSAFIYNNDALSNLSGLDNLTSIGGGLNILDNELLSDISSLSELAVIGNGLSFTDNPSLSSISGLHNITELTGGLLIQNNDALLTLQGLENLVSMGGGMTIWYNDALTSLTGLNNLTTIHSVLYVHENALLSNFEGLNNLNTIGGFVIIFRNPSMTSLNGLENLTSIDGAFQIRDNLALTDINALQNLLLNEYPTEIYNNLEGCNTEQEILDACSDLAKLQTHVFYDINQNKIQDTNEPNVGLSILITPDNYLVFTNPESIDNHPNWQLTTDSLSYFLNLEVGDCDTIAFGVYPLELISEIQTFVSTPPTRCNEFVTFNVTTKNLGTTIASGTFWLEVDENILATNFIDTPDTTIAPNLYGWFFEDLFPGQCLTRQIDLRIPGPPDFPVGDYLFFDAYADFEDQNGGQSSQTFTYKAEVRCSFDPNDKLVNPAREGDYTLFDENLYGK